MYATLKQYWLANASKFCILVQHCASSNLLCLALREPTAMPAACEPCLTAIRAGCTCVVPLSSRQLHTGVCSSYHGSSGCCCCCSFCCRWLPMCACFRRLGAFAGLRWTPALADVLRPVAAASVLAA